MMMMMKIGSRFYSCRLT